jgi:catechol 2,3-dioxygenase-like lactoylglutathione lyase family enzyme
MSSAILEHVNITVSHPKQVAALLCQLFDWRIRWQGEAKSGGWSVHVGDDASYLALYAMGPAPKPAIDSYTTRGGLNHIGVVVTDLDTTEALVREAGFTPHSHADYEPGRRFYFDGPDGVEIEVVSYAAK